MTESEINLLDKMADAIISTNRQLRNLRRMLYGFIIVASFIMGWLIKQSNEFDNRLAAIEKLSGAVGKKIEAVERFAGIE
jgi:hypothetical protein